MESRDELIRFLLTVWRRWGAISLIIGLVLAAAGSVVAISMFKPKYEAKLFFRVIQNREWLELLRGVGEKHDARNVDQWIHSEIITARVAADPRVAQLDEIQQASDKAALLGRMADVTPDGAVYAITVSSQVPANAAVIAETYWDKYEEAQKLFREQQSKTLMETLDSEIAVYTSHVKKMELDLLDTQKRMDESASAVSADAAGEKAMTLLDRYRMELDDNEHSIETVKREIRRFKENPNDTEYLPEDLRSELAKSVVTEQQKYDDVRFRHGPSHPKFIAAKMALDDARKKRARAAEIKKAPVWR